LKVDRCPNSACGQRSANAREISILNPHRQHHQLTPAVIEAVPFLETISKTTFKRHYEVAFPTLDAAKFEADEREVTS